MNPIHLLAVLIIAFLPIYIVLIFIYQELISYHVYVIELNNELRRATAEKVFGKVELDS